QTSHRAADGLSDTLSVPPLAGAPTTKPRMSYRKRSVCSPPARPQHRGGCRISIDALSETGYPPLRSRGDTAPWAPLPVNGRFSRDETYANCAVNPHAPVGAFTGELLSGALWPWISVFHHLEASRAPCSHPHQPGRRRPRHGWPSAPY